MQMEGRGGGKEEVGMKVTRGMTRVMHGCDNNIDDDDMTLCCHHSHLASQGKSAGANWAMMG